MMSFALHYTGLRKGRRHLFLVANHFLTKLCALRTIRSTPKPYPPQEDNQRLFKGSTSSLRKMNLTAYVASFDQAQDILETLPEVIIYFSDYLCSDN